MTAQQHAAAAGEVVAVLLLRGGREAVAAAASEALEAAASAVSCFFRREGRGESSGEGEGRGRKGAAVALHSLGEGERDRYTGREGRESPSGRAPAGLAATATERESGSCDGKLSPAGDTARDGRSAGPGSPRSCAVRPSAPRARDQGNECFAEEDGERERP